MFEVPASFETLAYRGNAAYFRQDGVEGAARDYPASLEISENPVVSANLETLLFESSP